MTINIENYTAEPDLLKDRVILITGAGSGIGSFAAKTFAKHGATVVLLGKTINKLEKVYDEIKVDGGTEPAIYPLNLAGATAKDYGQLATTIKEQLGQLNGILHCAAHIGEMMPIKQYDLELWQNIILTNLTAPFVLTQACISLLQQSADPRILFTTHQVKTAYWGAYGIAKAGIERFMNILADELDGDTFVGVNAIAPGDLQSPIVGKVFPGKNLKALNSIDSVMPAYLYFMGQDSNGVTGKIYDCNQHCYQT